MGGPDDPVKGEWWDTSDVHDLAATDPIDRVEATDSQERLETPPPPAKPNDRTMAGLGVVTPRPQIDPAPRPKGDSGWRKALDSVPEAKPQALLQPGRAPVPLEREQGLQQPERSPLDFVMRDMGDKPAQRESHDLSQFVSNFVGDTPPPVAAEPEAAMEPVFRRGRKRKQWLVAGAVAATAIAGTAAGVHFAGSGETPRAEANTVANPEPPAPTPDPVTPAAPAAPEVAAPAAAAPTAAETAAAPAEPPPTETAPPPAEAKMELVASHEPTKKTTHTTSDAAKPTTKATAKSSKTTTKATKKTATKTATTKSTKKPSTKKPTAKKTAAAKTSTKKKSTAKKSTTKKKTTSTTRKKS